MKKILNLDKLTAVTLMAGISYLCWACTFIYRSSFMGIDGKRYFILFDDAMISMRYAWNLSHGHGLVWNVGERVEGITNLLWTLWLSLLTWFLDRSLAVLAVQICGAFIVLGVAAVSAAVLRKLSRSGEDEVNSRWGSVAVFLLVLSYYPLSYWTLLGMETGLLALALLCLVWGSFGGRKSAGVSWPFLALSCVAIWTRPDALIFVALIMFYRLWALYSAGDNFRVFAVESVLLIAIAGLPTVFRVWYYGELWPNTYVLKLTGMPLQERILNGYGFIKPYLLTITPLLFLFVLRVRDFLGSEGASRKVLLLALAGAAVSYQVWVGGDPWPYWRMMVPVMPLLFILAVDMVPALVERVTYWGKFGRARGMAVMFLLLVIVVFSNRGFWAELSFHRPIYQAEASQSYVNFALAANELLTEKATIALVGSGTMPYYSNFRAIDMLGKSDKYIARLPPDLSGAISWAGMRSVPGHNKYDLKYSILGLKPTFVQCFVFGKDNFSQYAQQHYARVFYKGVGLWLLAGSKDVLWDKISVYENRPAPQVNP